MNLVSYLFFNDNAAEAFDFAKRKKGRSETAPFWKLAALAEGASST